jgi:type VI secretion system secreted protein Hcp
MKWHTVAVSMVAVVLATSAAVAASYRTFLKIDGLPGDAIAERHAGEIDVLSFNFGLTQTLSTVGGSRVGKTQVQDLHVVKRSDSASPGLQLAVARGMPIKQARLVCESLPQQTVFLTMTLENVLVSGITLTGSAGANQAGLTEEVVLAFDRMTWTYSTQRPDGAAVVAVTSVWKARTGELSVVVPPRADAAGPGLVRQDAVVRRDAIVQAVPKAKASQGFDAALRRVIVPGN